MSGEHGNVLHFAPQLKDKHQARDAASVVRFGPFELDLRSAELRKNDLRIRLQDQPFQILVALLERPGEVVLREEIRKKLWPDDTVVEFDHSINAAVKRLRDVLRESAEKPRYIETLARRGYRFIGQVETAPSAPNEPTLEATDVAAGDSLSPLIARNAARSRMLLPAALAAVLLMALAGAWYYHRGARARWAREVALPEARSLVNAGNNAEAFPLLYQALQALPRDPELNRIRRETSYTVPIRTMPAGASVYVRPYGKPGDPWLYLGQSLLENLPLPVGYFRWRITKPGFRTVESAAGIQGPIIEFILDREDSVSPGMVHVPPGNFRSFSLEQVHLNEFWIDKYEVTNRQFKEFVDKGGYQNRQYWREGFVKDGRTLSWEQAMTEFRDATGRPGPSAWEVGNYPSGRDDFPVSGVSWYEAMAYAAFAKKQIPTIHHWYRAAGQGIYSDILSFSNLAGSGPVRVGSRPGIGPFGTYDMAGNVKEWCLNAAGPRRYILGGGWNEGRPYYVTPDALSPLDRSSANGFRCVKFAGGALPAALTLPVDRAARDHRTERPVSDSVFRILQNFYSYDRGELKAIKESVDESSPNWRTERITFDAAYDRQRVIAWLYLPRNAKPPYQTIVYCPAAHSRLLSSIDDAEIRQFAFLMRSGRAVLFPIYQGTYERRPSKPLGPSGERDEIVQQFKDLRRSIDYLETRTDIASGRLGYFGISMGGRLASIFLAQEPRIRAATLAESGLNSERLPPEIDEINFVPRVRIPILMLNGRYDFVHLLDSDQVPMFRLLGSPPGEKRHVLFETGHAGPVQQYIKETLGWFEKYLGPAGT
jgi:eukaryotic-like serine/threonine-protein kinase